MEMRIMKTFIQIIYETLYEWQAGRYFRQAVFLYFVPCFDRS